LGWRGNKGQLRLTSRRMDAAGHMPETIRATGFSLAILACV
jgi:hypothetical protein